MIKTLARILAVREAEAATRTELMMVLLEKINTLQQLRSVVVLENAQLRSEREALREEAAKYRYLCKEARNKNAELASRVSDLTRQLDGQD